MNEGQINEWVQEFVIKISSNVLSLSEKFNAGNSFLDFLHGKIFQRVYSYGV